LLYKTVGAAYYRGPESQKHATSHPDQTCDRHPTTMEYCAAAGPDWITVSTMHALLDSFAITKMPLLVVT